MAVVETETHGQILIVRMNRPERLNAMGAEMVQMMAELDNKLQKNEADLQNKATQVDTDAIAAEKMINNGLVRLTSTSSLAAHFLALT